MAVAFSAMLPILLLPLGDSGFRDLVVGLAPLSLGLSATAGVGGAPFVSLALCVVHVSRAGIERSRRVREFVVLALALALFLGGGACFNEFILKPWIAAPRPSIELLATVPSPESPILGMSARDFYDLGNKDTRRAHLNAVLNSPEMDEIPKLPSGVRAHWLAETGYSFPSGHAFAAMLLATFFLSMGISFCTGWRLKLSYCLPAWAVLVCYMRPLLLLHSAADVLLGSLLGAALGFFAFVSARSAVDHMA